jgi:hypothetical protein
MTISLKQRSDYTHKHNVTSGRFGWLRLTPGYSFKVVDEILSDIPSHARVLDPFAGTATTPLRAAYRSHDAAAAEINPFLVWFGRTKLDSYSSQDTTAAYDAGQSALEAVLDRSVAPSSPPPIHNIERWWEPSALQFLCSLKGAIDEACCETNKSKALLMVAFCRTLIKLSNAAFNHQSMSFRQDHGQLGIFEGRDDSAGHGDVFVRDLEFVLSSALENPSGRAQITQGDARTISNHVSGFFDLVITSPPYPNRMSYIRELRPYMYWLAFLTNSRDAAEMDWASIGGTWGVATSRLASWARSGHDFCPPYLDCILTKIASEGNASGRILSNYVARYFEDMYSHLADLRNVLAPGAVVHYVVGNSTFYDVLLPVERLFADMLKGLGFRSLNIIPIRKRNSKKELVEFDVSACWNG